MGTYTHLKLGGFLEKIRKEIKEKRFRNDTIWATMYAGKNVPEVAEEKRLRCLEHVKREPRNGLSREPQSGNQREHEGRKDPKTDGWRRSMVNIQKW
jgi:hypothetical protein